MVKREAAFWRSLKEATFREAGDRGEGGPDKDPRGQKRPREETDPRPSPNTHPALGSRLPEEGTAQEEGPRLDGKSGGEPGEEKPGEGPSRGLGHAPPPER